MLSTGSRPVVEKGLEMIGRFKLNKIHQLHFVLLPCDKANCKRSAKQQKYPTQRQRFVQQDKVSRDNLKRTTQFSASKVLNLRKSILNSKQVSLSPQKLLHFHGRFSRLPKNYLTIRRSNSISKVPPFPQKTIFEPFTMPYF